MNCLNCGIETTNPKFCSRSCSATFTNKGKVKSEETKKKVSEKLKGRKILKVASREKWKTNFQSKLDNKSFEELNRNQKKRRLIKEFGHKCQGCFNSEWLGIPIMLELEHKDGNNKNDNKDNLLLLCPNCHSQTPTWRRGWKYKKRPRIGPSS